MFVSGGREEEEEERRPKSAETTPIASSRRHGRPLAPPTLTRSTRPIKSVRWNLLSEVRNPQQLTRDSSTDLRGRLSLALTNVRQLKEQLAEREEELLAIKVEKERYEAEHGKLYSQMSSLRNRCQTFESQLTKKNAECESLYSKNFELEEEYSRTRTLIADETNRHNLKIRSLEAQIKSFKSQISAQTRDSHEEEVQTLKDNHKSFTEELKKLTDSHKEQLFRHGQERSEIEKQNNELSRRLEEARCSIIKLSAEKASLIQDLHSIQDEYKAKTLKDKTGPLNASEELHLRLAELETERSNAKTALRKAMTILDREEALRKEMERKDIRIKELEELLKPAAVLLPSLDHLNASLAKMNLANESLDSNNKGVVSTPLVEINDSNQLIVENVKKHSVPPPTFDMTLAKEDSSVKNQTSDTRPSIPEAVVAKILPSPPKFAVPALPPNKAPRDEAAEQVLKNLSAIQETTSRLRQIIRQ